MDHQKCYNGNVYPYMCMLLVFLLLVSNTGLGQNVAINADGSRANPNAMLDIKSTDKGLLIPRISSEARQRIAPTQGLLVYDINTNSFWYNTGRQWLKMSTTSESMSVSGAWLLTGNASTVDGTNFLGTVDNIPLSIRVNNQPSGRIDHVLGNSFWGFRSGFSITTGNDNTGIGASALFQNTTGSNNTAVGSNALQTNSTGFHNAALGRFALMSNTSGFNNTAIGTGALFFNTEGHTNIAIGADAMHNNTIGLENTAVGYRALYNNTYPKWNTAIGFSAMYSNTDGMSNTAIGTSSMVMNTTGSINTAVGYSALFNNLTGTFNTALGAGALAQNRVGESNVAIGASLGSNINGSWNVGVGNGTMSSLESGLENTAVGYTSMRFVTGGNFNTAIGTSTFLLGSGSDNTALGNGALYDNNGDLNTAIGSVASVVAGSGINNSVAIGFSAIVNASNKVRIGNGAITVIEGQVPFTFPSDGRYKFGVQEDIKGLDFILQLRPVSYQFDTKRFDDDLQAGTSYDKELTFKGEKISTPSPNRSKLDAAYTEASGIRRSGFIAQEVEQAAKKSGYNFSGLIIPGKQQQHYSLSYDAFVVPLVKAVQEQQQVIDEQRKSITEQERKIAEQDKKMADMQRQLDELKKLLTNPK